MELIGFPFAIVDWATVAPVEHAGVSGSATWRTREAGDVRVRIVEYSPGYVADHWCDKGHVLLCLEGQIRIELGDGSAHELKAGMSCQIAAGAQQSHRTSSVSGARLFAID